MSDELACELLDILESGLFAFPVYDHSSAREIVEYLLDRGIPDDEIADAILDSTVHLQTWLNENGKYMVGEWVIAWLNNLCEDYRKGKFYRGGMFTRKRHHILTTKNHFSSKDDNGQTVEVCFSEIVANRENTTKVQYEIEDNSFCSEESTEFLALTSHGIVCARDEQAVETPKKRKSSSDSVTSNKEGLQCCDSLSNSSRQPSLSRVHLLRVDDIPGISDESCLPPHIFYCVPTAEKIVDCFKMNYVRATA